MHVGLLASDGCFSSGLTALIDVLSTAQAQRPAVDPAIPPIRIDVTGIGRKVTTGAGLTVPVTMHLRELPAVDVVVARRRAGGRAGHEVVDAAGGRAELLGTARGRRIGIAALPEAERRRVGP